MAHVGSGPQASIQYGSSPSEQGQSSPGFEELAMPLLDSLYNFARWLVRDQSDAEDLVQEAYLKALRNFTSFRSGTNFRAWMFQILKNTFLSSRTKLDRRMTIAMDLEEDSPVFTATCDSPESRLIESSDINAVRCAIERLPIIFREVVLLRDVEDASYQEISTCSQSQSERLCHASAEPERRYASRFAAVPAGRSAQAGLIATRAVKRILNTQMKPNGEVCMTMAVKFASIALILATACSAQEGLSVQSKGKQKWPEVEAQKIYLSACSLVQREFGGNRRLAPRVTLVLGSDKNEVEFTRKEIRLTKWNRNAFAQGAVWLAFEDLMHSPQGLAIATRAVNWADSTVAVEQLTK